MYQFPNFTFLHQLGWCAVSLESAVLYMHHTVVTAYFLKYINRLQVQK